MPWKLQLNVSDGVFGMKLYYLLFSLLIFVFSLEFYHLITISLLILVFILELWSFSVSFSKSCVLFGTFVIHFFSSLILVFGMKYS